MAVMRLVNDVYHENNVNPQLTPAAEGATPTNLVEKVEFKLPDSVKDGIDQAKKDYEKATNSLSVNILQFNELGKGLVKKHNLSPDAIMQLGFQVTQIFLITLHTHICTYRWHIIACSNAVQLRTSRAVQQDLNTAGLRRYVQLVWPRWLVPKHLNQPIQLATKSCLNL